MEESQETPHHCYHLSKPRCVCPYQYVDAEIASTTHKKNWGLGPVQRKLPPMPKAVYPNDVTGTVAGHLNYQLGSAYMILLLIMQTASLIRSVESVGNIRDHCRTRSVWQRE